MRNIKQHFVWRNEVTALDFFILGGASYKNFYSFTYIPTYKYVASTITRSYS